VPVSARDKQVDHWARAEHRPRVQVHRVTVQAAEVGIELARVCPLLQPIKNSIALARVRLGFADVFRG
jgi:hypothetical protein